jgi:hypothetical protein
MAWFKYYQVIFGKKLKTAKCIKCEKLKCEQSLAPYIGLSSKEVHYIGSGEQAVLGLYSIRSTLADIRIAVVLAVSEVGLH